MCEIHAIDVERELSYRWSIHRLDYYAGECRGKGGVV